MGTLEKAVKAAWAEIIKPDTFAKGEEFQDYVRSRLFPQEEYVCLAITPDYQANKSGFVESSKEPDFKFRSKRSQREFFVETKYRTDYYNGAIEWCKPYQLRRYKMIDKTTPVYLVLGVGGRAASPDEIFLMPLKDIKYSRLFPSFLSKYRLSNHQPANLPS